MKSKHYILGITILLALLLAACSPQASSSAITSRNEMGAEARESAGEEMASDTSASEASMDDEAMSKEDMDTAGDEMVETGDDAMMHEAEGEMEPKDDMGENNDKMVEGDDAMLDDKEDSMSGGDMMTPNWFTIPLTDVNTGETFTIADFKGEVVLVETMAIWCSNCFKQQGQVKALHELVGGAPDFISLGIDIDPNENAEALKTYTDNNGFDWLYTVASREVAREIGGLYGDQFLNPPSTPMLIIDRHGVAHPLPFGIKSADSLLDALQPFLEGDM